jgi:hypothetical protein
MCVRALARACADNILRDSPLWKMLGMYREAIGFHRRRHRLAVNGQDLPGQSEAYSLVSQCFHALGDNSQVPAE